MLRRYLAFLQKLSTNRTGRWGVVLATSSFLVFIIFELARLLGIITNAYVGLITYMLLPVLILVGLVLVPLGCYRLMKERDQTVREFLRSHFGEVEVEGRPLGSSLFKTIGLLTLANVIILGAGSMQMLTFMDKREFCGTACHSVMNPEWVTYQASPHARVPCVDCHVGEGFGAAVDAKLNGLYQVLSVTLNLYDTPIPTPVEQLRPARETCEKCHWPDHFYGTQLQVAVDYADDEESTPSYVTLGLKIDAGADGGERTGIHWHISEKNTVRYAPADEKRNEIRWVEVLQPDGTFRRFHNTALAAEEDGPDRAVRTMDCVDCHNRATHIYEDPEAAVNQRIRAGLIDRALPYAKREAVKAITRNYNDRNAAMNGIANSLGGYYRRNHPRIATSRMADIDRAIEALREIYDRNIHHEMEITWGTYPGNLGHGNDLGCFRCHNGEMQDEQGNHVSDDCTLCHSLLANEEAEPFRYLRPAGENDRNRAMHLYLQEEFLNSFVED
jgi:hypothetical protein